MSVNVHCEVHRPAHALDCECDQCQLEFPTEFKPCEYCGKSRYWEHMTAFHNDAGEREGYVCSDCETW